MNISDLVHIIKGTKPMPKCNDLYTLLGAVQAKEYSCPKCGKKEDEFDESEGYIVDGKKYPKYFNETKGSTIDGNYHYWDEVHCCTNCGKIYYFNNSAY